jgi:hypothetical protein
MYLIPIFSRTMQTIEDISIKQVWMFLEKNGSQCIPVEGEEEARSFASFNEIPLTGEPIVSAPFIFLPVNSAADLSSFYLWGEISLNEIPMKEAWRSFIWVVQTGDDVWGTNVFLRDIVVAGSHSVYTILERYFKTA